MQLLQIHFSLFFFPSNKRKIEINIIFTCGHIPSHAMSLLLISSQLGKTWTSPRASDLQIY